MDINDIVIHFFEKFLKKNYLCKRFRIKNINYYYFIDIFLDNNKWLNFSIKYEPFTNFLIYDLDKSSRNNRKIINDLKKHIISNKSNLNLKLKKNYYNKI